MKQKRLFIFSLLIMLLATPMFSVAVHASNVQQQAQFAIPLLIANTSFLNVRTGPGAHYTSLVTIAGGTELPVLGVAKDRVWYLVSTASGNGWVNVEYTIPRGDFRNVPQIDTSKIQAEAVQPNTPASLALPNTQPQQNTASQAPAPSGERHRAYINFGTVDLKSEPNDSSSTMTTLYPNDDEDYSIVGATRDANNIEWYALNVPNVGVGWIDTNKLLTRLSAHYRPVALIDEDSVGMMNNSDVVLGRNTEVFVLSISADSQRVEIETSEGVKGWVPFNVVRMRTWTTSDKQAASGVTVSQSTTTTQTQASGVQLPVPQITYELPIAIINTGNLNIRSGPGAHYTSVSVVPGGTSLTVLGVAPDKVWYLVQGDFGQGWINAEYAIFRGSFNNVPLVRNAEAAATVETPVGLVSGMVTAYSGPATHFSQVGTIYGPVEHNIVARTANFEWVQLNASFGFGWVEGSQVIIRGDGSLIPIVR